VKTENLLLNQVKRLHLADYLLQITTVTTNVEMIKLSIDRVKNVKTMSTNVHHHNHAKYIHVIEKKQTKKTYEIKIKFKYQQCSLFI